MTDMSNHLRHLRFAAPVIALAAVLGLQIGAAITGVPTLAAGGREGPAQTPPPGQPPVGPTGAGGQGAPGGQGGRGNAAGMLFNEICAACHGTDLAGGRAASLFAERFLSTNDDDTIFAKIAGGVPNTAMVPFKGTLTEPQIWQLVAYIRTQGANLKGKPVFVPDPNNQIIKSEKQTFKIEVVAPGLETPWGFVFLPDGRLLVTERPGRLRIIEKGKLLAEPVKGTPKVWERQDAGMLDVAIHPRYAQNGWIYLAYTEVVAGYVAPPPAPPADPARAGGAGRARRRSWRGQSAVDDGVRARQDQQEQRVGRRAAPVSRAARAVHAERLALRDPIHVRQGRASLLHALASAAR